MGSVIFIHKHFYFKKQNGFWNTNCWQYYQTLKVDRERTLGRISTVWHVSAFPHSTRVDRTLTSTHWACSFPSTRVPGGRQGSEAFRTSAQHGFESFSASRNFKNLLSCSPRVERLEFLLGPMGCSSPSTLSCPLWTQAGRVHVWRHLVQPGS